MKKSLIALAAAGVLASGVAAADSYVRIGDSQIRAYAVQHDPRYDNQRWNDGRNLSIDQREANMRNRLQRGIESGRVTRREARQLFRELDGIEAKERAFSADGRLGRRERDELHNDLDHLATRIRAQLRDEDRRS